jgi:hypothetical protein
MYEKETTRVKSTVEKCMNLVYDQLKITNDIGRGPMPYI